MSTTTSFGAATRRSSDLSRHSAAVLAEAEKHPVPVTRRDGDALLLMSETFAAARASFDTGQPHHRADGNTTRYLRHWRTIIDRGVESVVHTLTSTDDESVELRQSSPFAGLLSEEVPRAATASMEADIAFLEDPNHPKDDAVEGAIGELSAFHMANGIYAEGAHTDTAIYLPPGWRHRLRRWPLRWSDPADPRLLDPHDLAVAKLGAARPKDLTFVDALHWCRSR